MKGYKHATAPGLPAAERVLAEHLAALGGQSYEIHCMNRGTIWRFLAYCREVREQPADRLLLDQQQLQQWLIRACTGVSVAYARQRLFILAGYSRALARAGLLETDLMAEFKAYYGQSGWQRLISALRSDDSDAALTALRLASLPDPAGPLAATIYPYAELRRSLGLKGDATRNTLLDLDRFAQAHGITSPDGITSAIIEQWIKPRDVIPAVRIRKARCVKRFFDPLCTLRVVTTNPVPASLLATGKQRGTCVKPFIFTPEQVAAILNAAGKLPDSTRFPHRAQTCMTMLTLLCGLGLRHGEVRRLCVRDVDVSRKTLFIDQTKFHKSRFVPFGPKVGQCLERHLTFRRTILTPVGEDDLLFLTPSRVPLAYESLYKAFDEILRGLGITGVQGQRPPRVHDLRHTFAVHRLLRWYRDGVDVQSRLLLLSVFMGHVNVHSTQVYLTVTGDLLPEANDRFHRHVASVIDEEVRR
jgi:site-specific recombinase XerD